jgi:hypothetical protein
MADSLPIVLVFLLCRRRVADCLEQYSMIEPVDPLQRRELYRLDAAPERVAAGAHT